MSEDFRNLYYYYQHGFNNATNFPYPNNNNLFTYNNNNNNNKFSSRDESLVEDIQMLDPSFMSDYNTLERALGLSTSSSVVVKDDEKPSLMEGGDLAVGGGNETTTTPVTPNDSSLSSSSNEGVGGDEDSNKGKKDKHGKESVVDDGGESPKKENKQKKKGEKKQQQPRFAFMTKTEVDHLEDGYRWRKYGQKAVKNSPYPRSYYRCTTQKCLVKKRVERSFQDPTIVITTYEGQHNHHLPTNLRGNVAGILSPSILTPSPLMAAAASPSFHQELMLQMPHQYMYNHGTSNTNNSMYHQQTLTTQLQQQLQFNHDYGLLQDVIPPMFQKQEP